MTVLLQEHAWVLDLVEAPAKSKIVNLRYFAGFTVGETAETLGLSVTKVELGN